MPKNNSDLDRLGDNEVIYQYQLREVLEETITFEGLTKCANFLGVPVQVLSTYTRAKTKIIKNKLNGKTYTLRRVSKTHSGYKP